ncbi:MAG TPA: GNAT family protein [Vicinamibacterales bacterium]|jgi:ribosomal-protein-alanine N-acetyltransferase|nr:GNAT family protein [Vicinamibacterales bacterium]
MRSTDETMNDWRVALPELEGRRLTLREPCVGDAASLFSLLSTEEVSRFISPPPSSVEAFERYIAWSQRQRAAGLYVCFAIVPRGSDTPIGLVHVRGLGPGFGTADWGFAIGSEFWGKGIFTEAAELVLHFAFEALHTHRLEARAAVCNARGNGALRKLGAEREGLLRHAFFRDGDYLDQVLWSILAEDWRRQQQDALAWRSSVVH